jgi:hypothetical protein
MSRILLLSVVLASLSTVVGCAGSARPALAPQAIADDPLWTPREEVAMTINASSEAPAPSTDNPRASYRPNRLERSTRGAIHAATY